MKKMIVFAGLMLALVIVNCNKPDLGIDLDDPANQTGVLISNDTLYMQGPSTKEFYNFVDENIDNFNILYIVECEGSIDDKFNQMTAELLYENGKHTVAGDNAFIASGGVDLIAAGKTITLLEGSELHVHSWSDGKKTAMDYPRDHKAHQSYLELYDAINISRDFYWYTIETPFETTTEMTEKEINKFFGHKMVSTAKPSPGQDDIVLDEFSLFVGQTYVWYNSQVYNHNDPDWTLVGRNASKGYIFRAFLSNYYANYLTHVYVDVMVPFDWNLDNTDGVEFVQVIINPSSYCYNNELSDCPQGTYIPTENAYMWQPDDLLPGIWAPRYDGSVMNVEADDENYYDTSDMSVVIVNQQ